MLEAFVALVREKRGTAVSLATTLQHRLLHPGDFNAWTARSRRLEHTKRDDGL